ncbi:hypothetical protein HON22_04990 [Candidatus Peregrinibacteria bacterium]|nr:hypothetical protein [Candidatus Peregrinibacteria bacterium]
MGTAFYIILPLSGPKDVQEKFECKREDYIRRFFGNIIEKFVNTLDPSTSNKIYERNEEIMYELLDVNIMRDIGNYTVMVVKNKTENYNNAIGLFSDCLICIKENLDNYTASFSELINNEGIELLKNYFKEPKEELLNKIDISILGASSKRVL